MSLFICDVNGYIGELSPIHTWSDICKWVEEHGGERMKELCTNGVSLRDDEIISEIEHTTFPPDLMPTCMTLLDAIEKCELVVIVTDGA